MNKDDFNEEFGDHLAEMIIDGSPYKLISSELDRAKKNEAEIDWKIIGDKIASEVQSGKNHGFFVSLNLIDFAMQSYDADGENSIFEKFRFQYELAKNYSDQAGLERKFELYNNLVEEATLRLKTNSKEDPFYFWITRPLNRLAQLTQYWKGEEYAEPLWNRLVEITSEAGEDCFDLISSAAPWFVEKNPSLFERESI